MTEYCLAFSTCPDREEALRIARILTQEQLAACVSIVPEILSVYRWKGAVEEASEVLLLIKTARSLVPGLQNRLTEIHPYEVPEFITLPISGGLPAYLSWIGEETLRCPPQP